MIELARAFAEGMFQFVVSLAVATMLWLRGDALAGTLKEITERLGGSAAGSALLLAANSVRGVAYGVVGTAAIQAIAMALGLMIAGVPGAGLLGFLKLLPFLWKIFGQTFASVAHAPARSNAWDEEDKDDTPTIGIIDNPKFFINPVAPPIELIIEDQASRAVSIWPG